MSKIKFLLFATLITACTPQNEDKHIYSCAVLYRCMDSDEIQTRLALACASDVSEADDQATNIGVSLATENCTTWVYARGICEYAGDEQTCSTN